MSKALVLGIAALAVSAASASADGFGYRHHYGYYRLITIGTSSITGITESTQACTAAAIDPGDGEAGGN
jgi:hypothetical protein